MAYLHSERNCSSCRSVVREIVFAIPFLLIVVSPFSQNFKAETPSQSGSSNYAATNFYSPLVSNIRVEHHGDLLQAELE